MPSDIRRPAHARHVVDTVGAGDAFNAGFLDAWLAGASIADGLDAGARAAAVALARAGGARGLRETGAFGAAAISADE